MIEIYVKVLTGKTITLHVDPNDTVQHIKELIFEQQKIPVDMQRLCFNGLSLESDKLIKDYNIEKESTLYISLPIR